MTAWCWRTGRLEDPWWPSLTTGITEIHQPELAVQHPELRHHASTQEQGLVTITSRDAGQRILDERIDRGVPRQHLVEGFLEPKMVAHGSTVVILRGRPRGLPVRL